MTERNRNAVQVKYLGKGEGPPRDPSTLFIEVVGDRARESVTVGPAGMKVRVNRRRFPFALDKLVTKTKGDPAGVIYVRGIAEV